MKTKSLKRAIFALGIIGAIFAIIYGEHLQMLTYLTGIFYARVV